MKFLPLLLLLPLQVLAQDPVYPPLEEVVLKFFTGYSVPEPVEYRVHFERRPTGYFAVEVNSDFTKGKREQFYRFSSQSYAELKLFSKNEGTSPEEPARKYLQSNTYDIAQFDVQPYYGYSGWYKDVIALYENRDSLSDWELNALGRAYQSGASSLLHNITGYGDPDDQFDLPPGQNALTRAQVDQYLSIVKKELAAYDRLRKNNPDFMTPVGPVNAKYGSEVMDAFLTLLYFQDEATARQVLEPGLFDTYLLQSARNLLQSCPPDAVLFTWGDGDTYPLYYVQAMENLRTDVIIANLSLLVLPRYLSLIYSGPLTAKPLKTGFPELYFRETVIWQKSTGTKRDRSPVTMEWIYGAMTDSSQYRPEATGKYHIFRFEANAVALPVPAGTPRLGRDSSAEIQWLAQVNHFSPDRTSQLDILHANQWSRPLCFSLTCRTEAWSSWNPHLALEGMVYRLYPDVLEPVVRVGDGVVNTETGYRLWTEVFQFETTTRITSFDKSPYHQNNFLTGLSLARALLGKGETEKALAVARSLPERLPNAIDPWDYRWMQAAKLLGECGDPALGETIAHTVLGNYEGGIFWESDPIHRERAKEGASEFAKTYGSRGLKRRASRFKN